MIKVGIDNSVNALDDIYHSTRKKVQDIVTNSYDDIDNVLPDDIVDIDFSDNDKNQNEKPNPQNFLQENWEKFINLLYKK